MSNLYELDILYSAELYSGANYDNIIEGIIGRRRDSSGSDGEERDLQFEFRNKDNAVSAMNKLLSNKDLSLISVRFGTIADYEQAE